MHRSNVERGVATLCVGGGQGQALVVRNSANGNGSS
jgi:acetyl-CoA acetyltransferase